MISIERICLIFSIALLPFISIVQAQQEYTYYDHVQPILYRNCIECHQPGQVAPFSLLEYGETRKRARFIQEVTEHRYMPPWMASPLFGRFNNERVLSEEEIGIIKAWVLAGCKEGKRHKQIDWKKFLRDSLGHEEPDLVISMNKAHVIDGDNKEQFRIFVLPTHLPEDVWVKSVEFVPGNFSVVHHARIMIDTTNLLREDDGIAAGEKSELERTGVEFYDRFWAGWVPGNKAIIYPTGVAKRLPKMSDLVINIHYSPSPIATSDLSSVRVSFSKSAQMQAVHTFILDEDDITNGPFFLPAYSKSQFFMRSPLLPFDMEMLSVLPHMHKLGRSFRSFAVTPKGEIVPLIDIPHWNFNWQATYQFKPGCVLPKGTVIYAEATYDNTNENPDNPNFPPLDVAYGWGTKEEMMNLIFEYLKK